MVSAVVVFFEHFRNSHLEDCEHVWDVWPTQEIRDNRLKLTEIQSCFDGFRNLRVDTTPLVLHFSPKQAVRVPPETDVGARGIICVLPGNVLFGRAGDWVVMMCAAVSRALHLGGFFFAVHVGLRMVRCQSVWCCLVLLVIVCALCDVSCVVPAEPPSHIQPTRHTSHMKRVRVGVRCCPRGTRVSNRFGSMSKIQ